MHRYHPPNRDPEPVEREREKEREGERVHLSRRNVIGFLPNYKQLCRAPARGIARTGGPSFQKFRKTIVRLASVLRLHACEPPFHHLTVFLVCLLDIRAEMSRFFLFLFFFRNRTYVRAFKRFQARTRNNGREQNSYGVCREFMLYIFSFGSEPSLNQ